MSDHDHDLAGDLALPLPGLEAEHPSRRAGDLERAVRRTIAYHEQRGDLTEQHAGVLATALELARVATIKRSSGRMSTVSNDLRLLTELLVALDPAAGESGVDETLRAAMLEWETFNREAQQR